MTNDQFRKEYYDELEHKVNKNERATIVLDLT